MPFPQDNVLVFESWTAKRDASGGLLRDADGNLQRERLNGIHVLRKHGSTGTQQAVPGWEFLTYRPMDPSSPFFRADRTRG